jgi:DNA polymerase III subunit beta
MQIKLNQLLDIMDIMGRFVSKHATLPVLENIYLKAHENSLLIRATDMEKYVEIQIPVATEETAMITINAKTFSDVLRTIDDEFVWLDIQQHKDLIVLTTMTDSFQLKGIPASEFVATPTIQAKTTLQTSLKDISEGISKVEYAVTEKNFSPIMTGILMRTKEYAGAKKLVFVGTDSFRLAEYKIDIAQDTEQFSVVIPKIHVLDIKKVIDYMTQLGVEQAELVMSDAMIQWSSSINDMRISTMTLLIQWNFPEYENENILPTSFNYNITVNTQQCEKAIRKIGTITRSLNNYIAVESKADTLEIKSGLTDLGEGSTMINAQSSGEPVRFGLNGKYVSDFIKNIQSSDMNIQIVSPEKPIIFQDPNHLNYRYVIRPLVK